MAKLDLKKKVWDILSQLPDTEMTAREISSAIRNQFPDETSAKLARSKSVNTEEELLTQLVAEIGANWKRILVKYPTIKTVETRPRLFYYSTVSDEEEVFPNETTLKDSAESSYHEHDLYPVLGKFVFEELDCYAMRIDERRSSNKHGKRGNHWLFPDIVGAVNLMDGWHSETKELARTVGARQMKLFSFEIKKKINRANVRECFFQTLSNSSWANFAYLVAAKLDSKALPELRMLCASHGIGYINLDRTNPSDSIIMIPAKERKSVDWDSLDRLTKENKDAQDYLENLRSFHGLGRVRNKDWDLTPNN
ncbi:HrgA protein [Fretibacter rubidus]|uniref:HrgA protein n=1 Tax=Fretibacter rubidus TaxID=570162 RepID=UPI00352B7D2F